jgi:hypothetical protein
LSAGKLILLKSVAYSRVPSGRRTGMRRAKKAIRKFREASHAVLELRHAGRPITRFWLVP